jgi:hypothetical protein
VTAIFYLNDGWTPDHGGKLRLYPFPEAPPVDVAPLAGRLVLFSSTQMHHRWRPRPDINALQASLGRHLCLAACNHIAHASG